MNISGLIPRGSKVHSLSNKQILLEECRKREEVYTGIVNLAIHMGTLGFHRVWGGLTLHLPVILWILHWLLKNMRRRMELRAVAASEDRTTERGDSDDARPIGSPIGISRC